MRCHGRRWNFRPFLNETRTKSRRRRTFSATEASPGRVAHADIRKLQRSRLSHGELAGTRCANETVQLKRGASDGGHERDQVVVTIRSTLSANLSCSISKRLIHIAKIRVKNAIIIKDRVAAVATAVICDTSVIQRFRDSYICDTGNL